MRTLNLLTAVFLIAGCATAAAKTEFEKDTVPTSKGNLQITFIGHGTLMFEFDGKVIHVDPVAFLPMNLPYTMTPQMAAEAAKVCEPKILYPYHFGKTDTSELVQLLKDAPAIEVRIRQMQ